MAIDRTNYNLLADDSGGNLDGTLWTKNQVKIVLLDPIDTLITEPVSFTPTIISSGGGTPTYSRQVARWRKWNGLIHVTGRVTLATFGTLAAGTVSIGGLPATSVNVADLYSMVAINWSALTTAAVYVNGLIAPNSVAISLNIVTAAAVSTTGMQKTDLSATSDFIFTALYPST